MNTKRNPAGTGLIGLLVLLLATVSAFFLADLPIVGSGISYTAEFSELAGLKPSSEVRVAGVSVGRVDKIELDGDRVKVTFRVRDTWVGDKSTAAIEIKTLLGPKFLSLNPKGSEQASPGDTIPLDRTTSPYDVLQAFGDISTTVGKLNKNEIAQSLQVLTEAFSQTPADLRSSLDGVTRLSTTIASRDEELAKLFQATNRTTQIVADRNAELQSLIINAGQLLTEFNNRRQALAALLRNTEILSQQLRGLVAENEATLGPALDQLQGVVDTFKSNYDNMDQAFKIIGPFYRYYANLLGNGRWFDAIVSNLLPPGLPEIPGPRDPIYEPNFVVPTPNGGP